MGELVSMVECEGYVYMAPMRMGRGCGERGAGMK